MSNFQRKSLRSVATVFLALAAMVGSSSHAEAGLLGPSSDYIIQITPAARTAIEGAVKNAGGTIGQRYQYAFDGFVVKLPDLLLPVLQKIPNILKIEKDQPVSSLAIQQNEIPTPSWGLDRIDQREKVSTSSGYQGSYGYRSAGTGSTIYIGDTGIYPHEDLAGRISNVGFAGIQDGNGTVDCNGHGTHVASTAAGTKYGVAKNAKVVPVRILNCAGSGSYATVIAGLDWILSPLNTNPKTQAVLNLSIGGAAASSINDAVLRLTNAGITVVAAAGNDNVDACTKSPASAPTAITVGATGIDDTKAFFSNWGKCVDIHAPGYNITAGWKDAANATNTISGTSMATPHVTGAAAVFLGLNPNATVAQVADALAAQSTKGALVGLPADTVNNLLYVSPTDGGPVITPPAVQISTITGITHQQAQANVEINPNNAPTTARLEYASDTAFTSIVKSINLTPTPLDGGTLIALPVVMDGLNPSSTYYFRATANNESGSFTTQVGSFKSLAPPVTPPVPVATNPTLVTAWSAHLNGTINPSNGSTTVQFVYGTDPDFLTNTITALATPQTVSGGTVVSVGVDISFLDGNTKYYVKLVGSNSSASVHSPVISFTTPAVIGILPSVVTNRPANGLDTPNTVITGLVNPNGQTTSVKLVWDTNQSLLVAPRSVVIPTQYTGIDTVTVTATMTGLTPGYRYYYRFEATNAAGVAKPAPLTNVGNPIMPVISSTTATLVTQNSMTLNTVVNPGASNTRISFIYGTDPKLETGTALINGTPYALTNALSNSVTAPITGLKSNTTYYFRTKVLAYTGPLTDIGGVLLGPIVSVTTPYPARIAQSIAFSLPMSRFYGGAPTPLTAIASSGLPITYTTSTPTVCQLSKSETGTFLSYASPISTASSVTCTVSAAQNGDDAYSPAAAVIRNIVFQKENTGITAAWAGPITVAGTSLNLNVLSASQPSLQESLGGASALTVTSKTPTICKVSDTALVGNASVHTTTTVKALWNGTCQLEVSFAGNSYWLPTTATFSSGVAGLTQPEPGASAAQVINFTAFANREAGSVNPIIATATSGLSLTLTSMTPATCSIEQQPNGSFAAKAAAGVTGDGAICTVKAEQSGNDRWAASTPVIRSFTWTRKAQTINFVQPVTRFYGGAPTVLTATSTSGLPVTITTTSPTVCKVTTVDSVTSVSYATPLTTGSTAYCYLTASQAGDSIWLAAPSVAKSLLWSKETAILRPTLNGAVTISGTSVDVTVKSLSQPSLNEDLSGTNPLVFTSLTPRVCVVDSTAYQGTSTSHTRAILKAIYNGTCQYSVAFAGNSYWLPQTTTFSTAISGITTPQPGANAAQTISFAALGTYQFGAVVPLTVSASSGLPVTVTTTTPNVCVVTKSDAGAYSVASANGLTGDNNLCTLQATQAGDTRWAAATQVVRSFKFVRKSQSVSFTLPSSRYYGGAPTPLVGTSTSGLPITWATTTPNACAIQTVDSASVVTFVTPLPSSNYASCYVTASQAGDGTFAPAPTAGKQILWQKEITSIKATWSGALTAAGSIVDLVVASTSQPNLNESLAGSTPLTVTTSTPGVCRILSTEYKGIVSSHTRVTVKAMWNGTCLLIATFAGNSYWLPAQTSILASVTGMTQPEVGANAAQTAGVTTPATIDIGYAAPLAPYASSKLPVTFISLTPQVCVITPTATAFTVKSAPGVVGNGNICTLQVSQAGDARWAPALPVTRTITVNKAAMAIRMSRSSSIVTPSMPLLAVAGTTYVNAVLAAGIPSIGHVATATTSTPTVCSVTNVASYQASTSVQTQATISAISNGTCTVTWTYPGDDTKSPATLNNTITVSGVK